MNEEQKNWWDQVRGAFGADVEGQLEDYIEDLESAKARWEELMSRWGHRYSGPISILERDIAEARARLASYRGEERSDSRPLATKDAGSASQLRTTVADLRRDFEAAMRLSGDEREDAIADLANRAERAAEMSDELGDRYPDDEEVEKVGDELLTLLRDINAESKKARLRVVAKAVPGAHGLYR